MQEPSLKSRTASTLKWNTVDRLASQLLYALTGVVLARILSPADFGLVGAVLVFQAFASLLVDSGFYSALLQRKAPTQTDYSTILWFNLAMAFGLYIILYASAPLIADCFGGDERIIPLSRVMFLGFILNASSIVQVNRLMKRMEVRMVAVANTLGLVLGGVAGIALAMSGYGAWAIVWQALVAAGVKSLVLWTTQGWRPSRTFSVASLRSFFGIGSRLMVTAFLNTVFLNIYSFLIGNRTGLVPLGYYTQADKWSKVGILSLYQVVTSSFLPPLAAVQDEPGRFRHMCSRMGRFTAYLTFPALVGMAVMATPLFHMLFGTKWDASIILFQILAVRGIFTVFTGLYTQYLLALGRARAIMWLQVVRAGAAIVALVLTFPYLSAGPDVLTDGVETMLWGQLTASALTWGVTLVVTARGTGIAARSLLADLAPYAALCVAAAPLMLLCTGVSVHPAVQLAAMTATGGAIYVGVNALLGSRVQRDALAYVLRRS